MPQRATIDLRRATALLGGLSPTSFMRGYWHKRPLLVRQALPGVGPPLTRAALFALVGRSEVESRLIERLDEGVGAPLRRAGDAGLDTPPQVQSWRLQHGPFKRRSLPPAARPGWTLLVQGLDQHVSAAEALLRRFDFIPAARRDDLMLSWASQGGGVGPHLDAYDVFLIQVQGRRRWRIGRCEHPRLRTGVPLKLLTNFRAEQEWLLEPGDLLYLPPRWAHDGVAEGECMTCSVGFRAPLASELVRDALLRLADMETAAPEEGQDAAELRYADPQQLASASPGRLPTAFERWGRRALQRVLDDKEGLRLALGESWSEPKPQVIFSPAPAGTSWRAGQGLRLHAASRMFYDTDFVYLNGQSWRMGGDDARLLRGLADRRQWQGTELRGISAALRAWAREAVAHGWASPLASP